MLYRKALTQFENWKKNSNNHALLVTGARQVGKSYLVQKFAHEHYNHTIYFDLIENQRACDSFSQATSADDLAFRINVMASDTLVPHETVIIIDEVQECPELITYAKYLVSKKQYDYIFTGSLLGVQLENIRSFPVGYLHEVKMYPLDFQEFSQACGLSSNLWDTIAECIYKKDKIPVHLHERMLELFHLYLLIGGMPDAVNVYLQSGGIDAPRIIQKNIRSQYRIDITKYAPREKRLVIKSIYDLIPSQLAKQNRRFTISQIENVKRFTQITDDFLWLAEAGVALPTYNISKPSYPLEINSQRKLLKLFSSDIGLLTGSFLKRDAADILDGKISDSLGGIYENYVAQELNNQGFPLRYFTKKSIGELDFITERANGAIIAFEVKSGKGYKTHAAMNKALQVEHYGIDEAYVLAETNVFKDEQVTYIPLYALSVLLDD